MILDDSTTPLTPRDGSLRKEKDRKIPELVNVQKHVGLTNSYNIFHQIIKEHIDFSWKLVKHFPN